MITTDNFSSRHTSQVADTSLLSNSSQKSFFQWIIDGLCSIFEALGVISKTESSPLQKTVTREPSGSIAIVAKQTLPEPPLPRPASSNLPTIVSQQRAIPAAAPRANASAKPKTQKASAVVSSAQGVIQALKEKLAPLVVRRSDVRNIKVRAENNREDFSSDREDQMLMEKVIIYTSMFLALTKEIDELNGKIDELERVLRIHERRPTLQIEGRLNQLVLEAAPALEEPLQFDMD